MVKSFFRTRKVIVEAPEVEQECRQLLTKSLGGEYQFPPSFCEIQTGAAPKGE